MKESLSSSAPRSGEVEEDEELEVLEARSILRDRDMVAVFAVGEGWAPDPISVVARVWADESSPGKAGASPRWWCRRLHEVGSQARLGH